MRPVAGMCTPEVLETQAAVAKTYAEIVAMTDNGWRGIQPLFRLDIEPQRGIRRYIAIRSCTPNPRKSQKAAKVAQDQDRPFPDGGVLLSAGKDVVGFALAEMDFETASLCLWIVCPWATGESFDSATRMLVDLIAQAERDAREREPTPRRGRHIEKLVTMLFFKRESRMIAYLEKRRGFVPLEEYLEMYPETSRDEFPPVRECYLPRERESWRHLSFPVVF